MLLSLFLEYKMGKWGKVCGAGFEVCGMCKTETTTGVDELQKPFRHLKPGLGRQEYRFINL